MTIQELNQQVGRSAVYVAQVIPAEVTIVDGKLAYGRVRFQVKDCIGGVHWVNEDSLRMKQSGN